MGKQARCPKCQSLNVVQPAPVEAMQGTYGVDNPYAIGPETVLPAGGVAGRAYLSAHRGGMILALGILSVVFNVAGVPGLLAWVLGSADLKQMNAGSMDPEGRGMTQAGMIIGMIMTILVMVVFVLTVGFIVFIFVLFAGAGGRGM